MVGTNVDQPNPDQQGLSLGPTVGKVISIGEALFDLIADQKGVPRAEVTSWTAHAGGAPCNVATAAARLGLDVTFVTALGDDKPGDDLVAVCRGVGVRTHAIQRPAGRPTRDVFVVRDETGDREFAGFGHPGIGEGYADAFIDPEGLPLGELKAGAVLVTGTLGLSYPVTAAALRTAAAAARAAGCTLVVDANWRPVFWADPEAAKPVILEYLQSADLIKLSDSDLEALLGLDPEAALADPAAVAAHFPHARGVLLTAGEKGAAYFCSTPGSVTAATTEGAAGAASATPCGVSGAAATGLSAVVPAFQSEVVDTTGAGDAFTAGFLFKMFQAGGLDALLGNPRALKEAVVFASAAGASTCRRAGAIEGQPTLEQVQQLAATSAGWEGFW